MHFQLPLNQDIFIGKVGRKLIITHEMQWTGFRETFSRELVATCQKERGGQKGEQNQAREHTHT